MLGIHINTINETITPRDVDITDEYEVEQCIIADIPCDVVCTNQTRLPSIVLYDSDEILIGNAFIVGRGLRALTLLEITQIERETCTLKHRKTGENRLCIMGFRGQSTNT